MLMVKTLIFLFGILLIIPISSAYSGVDQVYQDSFIFLRSLPDNSTVLTWIDEGEAVEGLTKLKTVARYPSIQLLEMGALGENENYSGPLEPNEKIMDIAKFFVTNNEKEALAIAEKHKVKYVLVTDEMLFQLDWMQYVAGKCKIEEKRQGCKYYITVYPSFPSFNYYKDQPGELIWIYNDEYIYIPQELEKIILTKMFFKPNSLKEFKLVYSDSRTKIFKVQPDSKASADLTRTYKILSILIILAILGSFGYKIMKRLRIHRSQK